MSFGVFSIYYKSAIMLKAREGLDHIRYSNWHVFKKESQDKITRSLKTDAELFIKKEVKSFRDVVKNIAMGLMKRG